MSKVAAAALLAILNAPVLAHADGERGPMFGGSIIATHGDETDVAGVGAEMVFWYGRLGLAAEASRQWTVDAVAGPQVGAVSGSLRVLAFDHVVPSLLDSREVVGLGIELHGIVERAWWDDVTTHRDSYGVGLALRVRGASTDDRSNLLAESRVFVRVMKTREADMEIAARDTTPSSASGVGVVVGLGVLFGAGDPEYVDRLRRRNALDSESLLTR
jgi:hypothetical protein